MKKLILALVLLALPLAAMGMEDEKQEHKIKKNRVLSADADVPLSYSSLEESAREEVRRLTKDILDLEEEKKSLTILLESEDNIEQKNTIDLLYLAEISIQKKAQDIKSIKLSFFFI